MRGKAKNDLVSAIKDFSNEIALYPKNEGTYFNRGIAKYALKDYQGAFDDYSKGISLKPSNANSYLSRANASIKLKKYAQY